MSAGVREKLGIAQVGIISNVSGSAGPGLSNFELDPLEGTDYIIASRIDFAGVTNSGAVSYTISNGGQGDAGYCENGTTDLLAVSRSKIVLTIINNQSTGVQYNVICIYVTSDDFDCYVLGSV